MAEQRFVLPSAAEVRRADRFGLVETDEYELPFWELLTAILRNESSPIVDASSLVNALEMIIVTLKGTASDVHFGLLRDFISRRMKQGLATNFFSGVWPVLVDLALEMPNLFPEGRLPSLSSPAGTEVAFSRKQVACLVVHQFMCSLPSHPWPTESFVDLSPWYSVSSTVHKGAVDAYLTALFTYFERISQSVKGSKSILDYGIDEWPITFTMREIADKDVYQLLSDAKDVMLSTTRVEVINLPEPQTAPHVLGLPDGACVISANKCIGYGPSGTQEELNVGTTPEAYPAVLLAPPLADQQVLICRGAEAMVSIIGYGRSAKLAEVLECPEFRAQGHRSWKNRIMLFMDALELDVLPVEGDSLIPDIYPLHRLARDMILKAYSGFGSGEYSHIVTGLWGCGTFGGNRYIKCILQWCAAALAGIPELRFVLSTAEQHHFGEELARFVESSQPTSVSVKQMFDDLVSLKDVIHDIGPEGIFQFLAEKEHS
ncbi:hypothetical protein BJX64DRAFT_253624 [Aspergillus heterothallicus]